MKANIFYIIVLTTCISCADDTPAPLFTESFLDHVARNAPAGKSACYVREVQRKWSSQSELSLAESRTRASRGPTDDVNFAIKVLNKLCSVENKT